MELKNKKFVALLLDWFKSNKRDFHWRTQKLTPFQVLIAELMLQKTNATQVEKIFPNFIKKYPTAKNILELSEEDLENEFQPLGLFKRRARDLKKTAQIILENDSKIPTTKKSLKKLPGIGDYIANAIICFAFNQSAPIVDANVGRVIKRVYSFPVKAAPSRDKKLLEKMRELLPKDNFKEFNYAILDLAALICLPKNPRCEICPLKKTCNFSLSIK